jgi:hypothetical protein
VELDWEIGVRHLVQQPHERIEIGDERIQLAAPGQVAGSSADQ